MLVVSPAEGLVYPLLDLFLEFVGRYVDVDVVPCATGFHGGEPVGKPLGYRRPCDEGRHRE